MPVPEQARYTTPTMSDNSDSRRMDQQFNGFPIFASLEYRIRNATANATTTPYVQQTAIIVPTFYKQYDWTDVRVHIETSCYLAAGNVAYFGVKLGSNSIHDVARMYVQTASTHTPLIGTCRIAGGGRGEVLGAGKYLPTVWWTGSSTRIDMDQWNGFYIQIDEVIPAQPGSNVISIP